ncbi:hypothetical protein COY62_02270 [bacterium (Candidatus Howlettbacteria) CG_4_10_14_0_8_um_filter_40_9]|nr:MAG: hypothetical protein COY62_02270 [bacterium (Candidatus Howlettbacteria) CG_4_10_14_0_8_um_filter_40_9]
MFDIITIGGATRDVFFKTNEGKVLADKKCVSGRMLAFEYGAKIVPEDSYFSYGGGGMNTAVSFAKLGLKVAAKINIGAEGTGSLIHKELAKKGVNTSLVVRDKKNHTALSIIISEDGDHTMFLYRGANDDLKIKDWSKLKDTKWLYVSSLTGNSEKILEKLPDIISKSGFKLAWNPGSQQLEKGYKYMKSLLKNTSIIILNKAEATELVLSKNRNVEINDKNLLKEIIAMGPEIVVITKDGKGSMATDGVQDHYQKALSAKVKETTGAGDSYGSTFVAGIIKGYNIVESMALASKNAASVVSKVGAQEGLLSLKELQR